MSSEKKSKYTQAGDLAPLSGQAFDSAPSVADLLKLRNDTAMPLYQQIEEQLNSLIIGGVLPPGATLPAERHLAETLGISRTTVQRAYRALHERKILSPQGRLGSIVQGSGTRLDAGMDRLKGFTEEMQELGRTPSSIILQRDVVTDRSMASTFDLPSTTRFLRLNRIRCGDRIPLSHEIAWYNLTAAPGLAEADLSGSVYEWLRQYGVTLTHCEQTIEAATPTEQECEIFGFEEPTPCLLIKRRSYSVERPLVEYVEGLFRGDAYVYRLNLRV
jgi:GntR family transcriptional regulator